MWKLGTLFSSAALAGIALTISAPAMAQDGRTGITDTTIKIGTYAPLTGPQSAWGYPVIRGAAAVYEEANKKGGIHGRKIVIVEEDDACDPAKAVAAVKKLIHQAKVFLINGGVCTTAAMPTLDDAISNQVPYMLLVANADSMVSPDKKWVFRAFSPTSLDGKVIADFIKTNPSIKRVAVVAHPDEWGRSKVDSMVAALKGSNAAVVSSETIEHQATDGTAQVLKMKSANPDVLVLITRPVESATVLRAALTHGLRKPVMLNGAVSDLQDLLKKVGVRQALDNTFAVGIFKGALDSAEMKPQVARLLDHFPKERVQTSSFWGTAGAIAIVEALRRAGPDLTREKFVAALEGIKNLDAGPLSCRINYSKDNHEGCVEGTMLTLAPGTDKTVVYGPVWKAR